jgi:cephalosporin-C deacetylase-like acetyl esterase
MPAAAALAASPAQAAPRSYDQEHPNMLLSHLGGKLNRLTAKWDGERAKLKTAADIEARNAFVREKFREMLGPFPERCALDAIVSKSFERPGYRVENVLFQSRPDFWVTGNLYVPTSGAGPFPALISPCGHAPLARMYYPYQTMYFSLVKAGFVVLSFDPVGQGERRHYWNPQTGETEHDFDPIYEHSMPGQLLLLTGENLTNYRVWDGMRAIDYLLTRPEVDKQRVGCAGHSGGGTLTLFISALDERVRCAVVSEGGTGHRWPVNFPPGARVGPSDVEQNIFPAAVHGVDLCDLHVAIAPRPLMSLIEDYSPRFNAAADHIRARYQQMGVGDKFATEAATDPHAWTFKLRQATTRWFCKWFQDRPGPEREPDFEPETPETLYATPNGSIRYSHQGDTVFSILVKKPALPLKLVTPADIRRVIHYTQSETQLEPRLLTTTPRKGYSIEKLEFLSEAGIHIPTWTFVPERPQSGATPILWVNEAGKQADGMEFGALERLARRGFLVSAIDVRGVGDTRPAHTPSIMNPPEFRHLFDTETAMSYMAWFMDESLFGMRVRDVVRGVDYLTERVSAKGVRVVGKGAGALWAVYAAALDPRIDAAICDRGLLSYRTLTQSDRYLHNASIFLRDVLQHFDLPQVSAAVAPRQLVLVDPVDAMKRPAGLAAARRTYEFTHQEYAKAGAVERFRIAERGPDADPVERFLLGA